MEGYTHTHLESIPTFYSELIWLHLTSSKCQIDILIPHSDNCFLFSASTGLAPWRTRTTATSRASPTLSARTTSGCFQSLVRCIFCGVEYELWMDGCFTLWCLCPNGCSEILGLAIIWSFGFPFYPSSQTSRCEESGCKSARKFWILARDANSKFCLRILAQKASSCQLRALGKLKALLYRGNPISKISRILERKCWLLDQSKDKDLVTMTVVIMTALLVLTPTSHF